MKNYKEENWSSNNQGIFVTGSYDDFSEVCRRINDTEWEIVRFIYETNTYEKQGENLSTSEVMEMMDQQGFEEHEIIEVIKDFIPSLEISFVENEIMNQLSYEVSNQKIKNKGFEFNGNLNKGIGTTINLLRNSNNFFY